MYFDKIEKGEEFYMCISNFMQKWFVLIQINFVKRKVWNFTLLAD